MNVFVISHDQGVDGGRAIEVFRTESAAVRYMEEQIVPRHRDLKRCGLRWESLGDTFLIDEFEVRSKP